MPWELGTRRAGAALSALPLSPVSPRGRVPGAPVLVTCFQCLMSERLIQLEGEVRGPGSCSVWLAGPLWRQAVMTASTLSVCFTPKPPIHGSAQAAVFSASPPFKRALLAVITVVENQGLGFLCEGLFLTFFVEWCQANVGQDAWGFGRLDARADPKTQPPSAASAGRSPPSGRPERRMGAGAARLQEKS